VTLGPDLDWLADDEGNLRPEAARIVGETAPGAALPRPTGSTPAARATPRRVRVPSPWLPVVVIGAVLIGLGLGRGTSPSRDHSLTVAASTAVVNGMNVNLRSAPGLYAPVLSKLRPGDVVRLHGERDGWVAVESTSGLQGFVFGALLRGATSSEGRPAAITAFLSAEVGGRELVLRPGERVLAQLDSDGSAVVLVASGVRLRIAQSALVILD
jgi:hypothetical protein